MSAYRLPEDNPKYFYVQFTSDLKVKLPFALFVTANCSDDHDQEEENRKWNNDDGQHGWAVQVLMHCGGNYNYCEL